MGEGKTGENVEEIVLHLLIAQVEGFSQLQVGRKSLYVKV